MSRPAARRGVDLLVAGGGVAGMACAVAAADLGLRSLLVEKTAELGGAARWSGGNLIALGATSGIDHLRDLSFGKTDEEVLRAYAEGLAALPTWLADLGAALSTYPTSGPGAVEQCWPHASGAEDVRYYRVGAEGPAGPALLAVLTQALADRVDAGLVEVAVRTRVVDLRPGRDSVGVDLEGPSGTSPVLAGAVALTTGGFEGDPALCDAYLPVSGVQPLAQSANTGDGLRLAQAAGAAVWHMSNFFGYWGHRAEGHPTLFAVRPAEPGHVLVDPRGHRFCAETGREVHDVLRTLGAALPDRPHLPALPAAYVLDRACLDAGPLSRMPTPNDWGWSADNRAELRRGWIVGGVPVEALAGQLDVAPGILRSSLERYNALAARGRDDDHGRPSASMRPLDLDELYAVRVWPGVATTAGGPRRDALARLVDRQGDPLPRLLAAGGNGSVWGHLTQHGGGLTDALVFGRIAARTAAAGVGAPAGA
ncbi:FAD-binding protein [Nocardioides mangrovi]|uniref:FAD-binding protein n=1 Tax=Nocardioides mangrovi TaxID=2874580 RepID=A0ABS7UEV2_9ACTN|nr:FAD-binding protein [Nocardioides mangrovi]MBZ5739541.1 FAD-binding protein [Nocardioides mangrovi]